MNDTTRSPLYVVSHMYESLLYEMSYDLHERYAQLLTSALHRIDSAQDSCKETQVLLSHLIEEMRSRSNEIYPLSFHEYGLAVAFKRYIKEVERRYGIRVEFPTSYKLTEVFSTKDVLAFRALQLTIRMIVEYADTDEVFIEVDRKGIVFRYHSFLDEFPPEQEDLLEVIKKDTTMEMQWQRNKDVVEWRWFKG
ncbi:hypothetical protein CEH05_19445 [Halobacillus halophilus]|uniref:Homolog to histidine kinase dimerisation domain n=2 Tax=Halobacillus halophilus TaxID=1570 RepID=I0JT28_HALH3|nr:hypothetical protein CEH05_19445 [Halobacillus halophilus]CCG47300.1 homolog to histidine kinase dimerisation domain [Halobacillus halophilus DSM 2266]